MKRKLLNKNELKPNKVYYQVARNWYTGKREYKLAFPKDITFTDGTKHRFTYAIWTDPSKYNFDGYFQPVKKKVRYRKKK